MNKIFLKVMKIILAEKDIKVNPVDFLKLVSSPLTKENSILNLLEKVKKIEKAKGISAKKLLKKAEEQLYIDQAKKVFKDEKFVDTFLKKGNFTKLEKDKILTGTNAEINSIMEKRFNTLYKKYHTNMNKIAKELNGTGFKASGGYDDFINPNNFSGLSMEQKINIIDELSTEATKTNTVKRRKDFIVENIQSYESPEEEEEELEYIEINEGGIVIPIINKTKKQKNKKVITEGKQEIIDFLSKNIGLTKEEKNMLTQNIISSNSGARVYQATKTDKQKKQKEMKIIDFLTMGQKNKQPLNKIFVKNNLKKAILSMNKKSK